MGPLCTVGPRGHSEHWLMALMGSSVRALTGSESAVSAVSAVTVQSRCSHSAVPEPRCQPANAAITQLAPRGLSALASGLFWQCRSGHWVLGQWAVGSGQARRATSMSLWQPARLLNQC
jgi:hypothetical protein